MWVQLTLFVYVLTNCTDQCVEFFLQSYSKDHILLTTEVTSVGPSCSPLSQDDALPGDTVVIHHCPFIHQSGIIEWINTDGKLWVLLSCNTGNTGSDVYVEDMMVSLEGWDTSIKLALNTLAITKDKGYNVVVSNTVEVARGDWHHFQGVVKRVDFTEALLDIVSSADGNQVSCHFIYSTLLFCSSLI